MANETLFSGKAEAYGKGRPGYAAQAVALAAGLLPAGGAVADVGSGTGLLAAEFLRRGVTAYCVEPNAQMRAVAEATLGGYGSFRSVAAPAEDTGLPDKSVALVTAASAFHWFDRAAFRRECLRVLQPGGYVCVFINAREYDAFTSHQHEICLRCCPGFKSLRHGLEETEAMIQGFFAPGEARAEFPFPLKYTKEKFIARSLSSSYAPAQGDERYGLYVRLLRQALEEFFPGGDSVSIPNSTVVFWGKLQ